MFYFFDPRQNAGNAHHYRGILFEQLLRRFLEECGYRVTISRRKHRSLEYDISGSHGVDQRKVIGEAKAHEATITGQDVAAFVGKYSPLYWEDNRIAGLFLSTSAISPEADDFLEGLRKTPFSITRISGIELEEKVRVALGLPGSDRARSAVAGCIPFVSAEHILQTDTSVFTLVEGCSEAAGFTDRFAVIRHDGTVVTEVAFLDALRASIQSLQSLEPAGTDGSTTKLIPSPRVRTIPFGLLTANDWVDYRRPAPTQYFVGRQTERKKVIDVVALAREGSIIEVKARSGVGKSSLLSVLAKHWLDQGDSVELHDSRDVHSATDVLSLLSRFTRSKAMIRSVEDVPAALRVMGDSFGGHSGIFIVDQFEATFQKPEVFATYEYIALAIARSSASLSMIFARKDDLLTTHDEIGVSLDRLRALAVPVSLDDFTRPEAAELVRSIAEANPTKLNAHLLSAVLEFAQGFPWLIKRTMAHVLAVLARGVGQKELLSAGLELEDLFEEELRGLDEMERGYLRRLAAHLPATYHHLMQRYEGDSLLPKMLETLRERKLLRLSAGTYDTYNDVFKEFLLYNRLPDSSQAYMFRQGPVPVMATFGALRGRNTINPEELGQQLGTSLKGVYNLLRELRVVGLVARSGVDWVVPTVVRQYEHQGRLAEYVRQSLMKNVVVADFLVRLERRGRMTAADVQEFLQEHFSFVDAKPKVWLGYARTFLLWLKQLRFVTIDNDSIAASVIDRATIYHTLGNLDIRGRGTRRRETAFLPSRRLRVYEQVLAKLAGREVSLSAFSGTEQDSVRDLMTIGAIKSAGGGSCAGVWTPEALRSWATAQLNREPYLQFWDAVKHHVPYADAVAEAFKVEQLAPATRTSFGIMLVNWGKDLGLLPHKRFRKSQIRRRSDDRQGKLFPAAVK